ENIFHFGTPDRVRNDGFQTHVANANNNDEAKEENWIKVTGKSKTGKGEQAGKPKSNLTTIFNKGKDREANATPLNKKPGQVGRRVTSVNTHANTPSKFAIRKRQRSSSAQSSPELRQITSAKASSSGTKNEDTIQEVARKDVPVVTEVPPKPQMQT
ncbi:hypothetical protein PIB30_102909, partial [Stylosanthes scabra]|nr:hypothetical protein [Stylosanthes scabra]